MDPDTALKNARKAIQEYDHALASSEEEADAMEDVINSFAALDQWLSKGGFLPDAWKR